ncbi:MAG TPA: ribbon-helix-helix domain-containing protein [Pseudobdellovibrionaceae bacterium]|nr:ribbon-helix-helix domain-containing protein [Pseudobdellovibrionaceae bacterium]
MTRNNSRNLTRLSERPLGDRNESPGDLNYGGSGSPRADGRSESSRKLATTVYITEEQQALLKELNRRSRVPIAEYIREGIDLVLDKHRALLPGQLAFGNVEPSEQLPNSKTSAESSQGRSQSSRPASSTSNIESTAVNKEEEN